MNSVPGLMNHDAVRCSVLHGDVFLHSGHSLGIPSYSWVFELSRGETKPVRFCLWPVIANEKQARFQQRNWPCLCAIPHYPWHVNSASIISRSTMTADLFCSAHYKETSQMTRIRKQMNHINTRGGAAHSEVHLNYINIVMSVLSGSRSR